MALNSSGPISLAGTTAGQSIEIENGGNGTTQISLNDAAVRSLAGVPSGAITMPTDFYGKANRASISYTFSANTSNASLNLSSISGYISGKSDITVTVGSGVYLWASSVSSTGLSISGGTTGDTLTIVNNGFILGAGGQGAGYWAGSYTAPVAGSNALNLGFGMSSCTINNTNGSAYIAGGGGGGGRYGTESTGGGGAGGGQGGDCNTQGYFYGGTGGSPGASGGNGAKYSYSQDGGKSYSTLMTGGGGGRILPGVGGAGGNYATPYASGGGAGGGGTSAAPSGNFAGGSGNSAGTNASGGGGGGGGGWGASGGSGSNTGGAAGGKAVNLNGKTVTWTSGNTTRVYGTVS